MALAGVFRGGREPEALDEQREHNASLQQGEVLAQAVAWALWKQGKASAACESAQWTRTRHARRHTQAFAAHAVLHGGSGYTWQEPHLDEGHKHVGPDRLIKLVVLAAWHEALGHEHMWVAPLVVHLLRARGNQCKRAGDGHNMSAWTTWAIEERSSILHAALAASVQGAHGSQATPGGETRAAGAHLEQPSTGAHDTCMHGPPRTRELSKPHGLLHPPSLTCINTTTMLLAGSL